MVAVNSSLFIFYFSHLFPTFVAKIEDDEIH